MTQADPAQLRFRWDYQDSDGGHWKFSASFQLADWGKEFTARYELSCDKPARLLALDGPMVYALDRDEAVFPGLQWLVDDEVSSSSLDIAEDHADRMSATWCTPTW